MLFIHNFVDMYKYFIYYSTILICGLEDKKNTFVVTLTIELIGYINTWIR